jgi:hypothetical protein
MLWIAIGICVTSVGLGMMLVIVPAVHLDGDAYDFRALDDSRLVIGTSKLDLPREVAHLVPQDAVDFAVFMARFRGSLLQLFGEPLVSSTESDEAFSYIIEARRRDGATAILTAYQGSSGSALGGKHQDPLTYPAAAALWRLIVATPPADFRAMLYDSDTDYTVIYGCSAGSCYYAEMPGNQLDTDDQGGDEADHNDW